MPITNTVILRKRLNELTDFKKKFAKDIEAIRITRPDNYQYFFIIANNFNTTHIDYLKQMKFDIRKIEGDNDKVKILVGKEAVEKRNFPEGFIGYLIWEEYVK